MRFILLAGLVACSGPSKPPVEPPLDPPASSSGSGVDAGVVAEVDPSPEALAVLAKLDGPASAIDVKATTVAISILARQQHGRDPIVAVVQRPTTATLATIQAHAIRELAKRATVEPADRQAVVPVLVAVASRPLADFAAPDPAGQKKLFVLVAGPALEGLADLHAVEAVDPALRAMFRHPPLLAFAKRALVAAGPTAKVALVKLLRGEHAELEKLIRDEKLDQFCGDPAKPLPCKPLAIRDAYAAELLGHFYDPATAPPLLAALGKKPLPYYYLEDGKAAGVTQQLAIFDALRRIGADAAAKPFEKLWTNAATPAATRLVALASYPFVTADTKSVKQLAQLVTRATAPIELRREAAIALSRQSRDPADIAAIRKLSAGNKDQLMTYLASIPRIAIAAKCKDDLACYASTERLTTDGITQLVKPHLPEVELLEPIDREELGVIAIDRAAFELRRAGQKATAHTETLLELASSDRRDLRNFGSLALPRVAPSPCPKCVESLDRAIAAAKHQDAAYELTLLRDYFWWSGKSP